ncbi:MAG: TIGR00730 family Rossman fold protein [Alphaproteobacteria bacterium]|nr:TIGR00730 family Rossman fold protein [Alphaproteobacteria bacterium]
MPLFNLKHKKKYSVAVFCGASFGKRPIYTTEAKKLGNLIAKSDMRLVYGAGGAGLMGVVAHATLDAKGDIYAVTEKVVATWEHPVKNIRYRTAPTIQKRKLEFIEHSDSFVILPGGAGTFDEFFDIFVKKYIAARHKKHAKKVLFTENRPIIVINIGGFYDPLIAMIKLAVREGFMLQSDFELFTVVKDAKSAIEVIKKHRAAAEKAKARKK